MAKRIRCPKCKCTNVSVELVSAGMRSQRKSIGLGGRINNAARGVAGVATLGISNLVWRKSGGTTDSEIDARKVAICQECGYDWEVK